MSDNPNKLPLWKAVMGRKNTWKGTVGEWYYHLEYKAEGVGVSNGDRVHFQRRCATCSTLVKKNKDEHCHSCGGGHACVGTKDDGVPCTRLPKHVDRGERLCSAHWVARNPAVRGCPGCGKWPKVPSRDDGLCGHCVHKADVVAKKEAHQPALDALVAEYGVEKFAGLKVAKEGVRYAGFNKCKGHAPYLLVVKGGSVYPACTHPACNKVAEHNAAAKETKFCIPHGGGPRCPGTKSGGGHPCGDNRVVQAESNRRQMWYDGQCPRCFCVDNPNDPRALYARKWYKAKEQEVVRVLTAAFSDYDWTIDKRFAVGRCNYRPDMRTNNGRKRVVVVEIDEDSHRTYGCETERARERAFFANVALGAQIAMVRFNPDQYVDCSGTSRPSCFYHNKEIGNVTLHPNQLGQWEDRCAQLVAAVDKLLDLTFTIPEPEPDRVLFSLEICYDNIKELPTGDVERARQRLRSFGKMRKLERADVEAAVAAKRVRGGDGGGGQGSSVDR